MSKFDEYTIEPNPGTQHAFAVYGHGVYEEWSVLAGQERRTFLDSFETIEQAQEEYPQAQVLNHSTKVVYSPMPECPPDWFDPLDIGEEW